MLNALWGVFPRLMEENINGLLNEARPTALRALQIYRALKNKGFGTQSVERFSGDLDRFFSKPRFERKKSDFDIFLDRPMDHATFSLFQLDFRSGVVAEKSLADVASWAHHLIRVSKKIDKPFMSLEIITRTLHRITTPTRNEKAEDITFSDFCTTWKSTVNRTLGYQLDPHFEELLNELEWLDHELKNKAEKDFELLEPATIPLSQIEVNWLASVRFAAIDSETIPKYPLNERIASDRMQELFRVIKLYSLSRTSTRDEILRNRDKIRATLVDRCEKLLGYSIRLAS